MASVGTAYITFDANLSAAFAKIDQLEQRVAQAKQGIAAGGGTQAPLVAPQIAPIVFPAPDPAASAGIQAYIASLRAVGTAAEAAASPIEQFIADVRAQGAALGKTEEQIDAHLAALSREALAAGDVARANQLLDASVGKVGQEEQKGTSASLQRAQAQARAALAARDYQGAITGLASELQKQGDRSVAVINAERQLIQVENQAAAAAQKQAREVQQAADAELRLAQIEARAQSAAGNRVGALQTLNTAQSNVVGASDQARASVEAQAASLERSATITGAFNAQLSSLLNPLALVAVGVGLATQAAKEFDEGFKLNANLDETNRSVDVLLGGFRNVPNLFADATNFANKYKFTQKEVNEAINDAIPVIRRTDQGMETILGTFERLRISKPDKTFNDAARAIGELQTGQLTSIEKIFNVPAEKAQEMKRQIDAGADAITVVNDYLNKTGITMDALAVRTQGVAGKQRELTAETEKYERALAERGGVAGLFGIQAQIDGMRRSTQALSTDTKDVSSTFRATLAQTSPVASAFLQVGDAYDYVITQTNRYAGTALPTQQSELEKSIDSFKRLFGVINTPLDPSSDRTNRTKDDFVNLKEAVNQAAEAFGEETTKKQDSALATDKLNKLQKYLADIGPQVAGGLLASAEASNVLQQIYGFTAIAAQNLIDKQVLLAQATQNTAVLLAGQEKNTQNLLPGGAGIGAPALGGVKDSVDAVYALQKADADLTKAQQDAILATGTASQKVAIQQQRYNDAVKQFGAQSPEAVAAQTSLTGAQTAATAASRQATDDQIALAKATGDTATARKLLNQELAAAKASGDVGAQAKAIEALKALDKPRRTKGISALDKSELALITDKQARLDEINHILEKGNLTQLQRNQYLIEARKLQDDINDAVAKQRDLETDIALAQTHDAQDDLKAKREAAGLERALRSGRISADQRQAAQLRLSELTLENQKRENDIADKQADQTKLQRDFGKALDTSKTPAGGAPADGTGGLDKTTRGGAPASATTPQVPIPSAAQLAQQTIVNVSITVDKSGNVTATTVDPNTILNIVGNTTISRNLSGGTP